jgi:hypothetical protein
VSLVHPRAVEGLVLTHVLPGVPRQNTDVEVLPDRIGIRATSTAPVMGDSVRASAFGHLGSSLEIIIGLALVVPQLSARIEVVRVTFAYALRPAFCVELFWPERSFGVLGVGDLVVCSGIKVESLYRGGKASDIASAERIDMFLLVLGDAHRSSQSPF